jgi:signal transduction histidine kinase
VGIKNYLDSIAFRVSVSIAVVVAATTIAVGWLILREERRTLESELQSKGRYLAEIMSHHVIEPLLYEERHAIFSLLQGSMKSEESLIVYADVFDKKGELIVQAYKNSKYRDIKLPPYNFKAPIKGVNIVEDSSMPIYHISFPIDEETLGIIGFLRLCITKEFLFNTLELVRQKLYVLAAAIIFIGIMLGLWMARRVLRPILILNKGVKRVGEGEVGVEVPVVGDGEIKELALSFNKMSRKLKELIHKIKSAQEHLVRTEKLYAVGEFSAGVAHEIKNPLTSIKMLMQTVQQKRQALTNKDFKVIEEEINRIDHIVKEFLAFARPEKAEKSDVNINDVLQEVVTVTKPMMEQSTIHLLQKLSSPLPNIKGNQDALKQMFLNIMLNAIQAMNDNGGTLTIETSSHNGVLSTVISDTGDGISEKDLNRIFDPFFTTKEEGTGMGLALTHNIINDHSGKIDIDSTPGRGTAVKVELPL